MPEGCISVARPSRYGNPFTIVGAREAGYEFENDEEARELVAYGFDSWLTHGPQSKWWFDAGKERFLWILSHLDDLRGHDLACYCPLTSPHCHVNTYLRLANGG
jgi:hypothetical protein